MKRTSILFAAICCTAMIAVHDAQGIDRTRTGGTTPPVTPETNRFNPEFLPGQGGIGNLGSNVDPFLPNSGIYNPFPTLPGITPNPANPVVPNPQPGNYPATDTPNARVRVQDPLLNYLPPGQNPAPAENRWRLGVMSRDTEQGVRIHEIVRGSAAERAGLEVNDLIVNVQGYQVGIVNGTLFELAREFERNADQNGMVTMLVQDNRTKNLINLSVQLDSRFSRIQGTLGLNTGNTIPNDAKISIELQEIVRQGAPPLTIARQEIVNPRQYPVPFEIQYDPAQLSNRGQYVLSASVTKNGRHTFETIQSFPVNNQGQGDGRPLALRLDAVRPNYDNVAMQIDDESRVATIVRWFNEYLGRSPTDKELTAWLGTLDRGYTMRQVQLQLLGTDQLFNQCNRNKETYVKRVHELLVGAPPTQPELDYWLGRYDALGGIRRDLASEFQDAVGIR